MNSCSTKTRYEYDANQNTIEIVDGRGNSTLTAFDGYDRQMKITDPMQNFTSFTYDDNSLLKTRVVTGALSGQGAGGMGGSAILQSIEFFYDGIYRKTKTEEAILGQSATGNGADGFNTTTYTYDRNSRLIQLLDDNNHRMRYYYDGADRLIGQIDELNNEVEFVLDANGNATQTIERETHNSGGTFTSSATYDALNRARETTDPIGNRRELEYDAQNNLIKSIDAQLNVVEYQYDLVNRQRLQIQHLGLGSSIRTERRYDKNNNLFKLIDDRGSETTYAHDVLDRVTSITYADGISAASVEEYDGNDNVVQYQDPNGNTIINSYDLNNRVFAKSITYASGQSDPGDDLLTRAEFYEYDGLNRFTKAEDEDSVVENEYDSLSRITKETQTWVGSSFTRTVQNQFDGVGNRTRLNYPSGPNVRYNPDELNRIENIEESIGNSIASYKYLGPTRVLERNYDNAVKLLINYDRNRRIIRMAHSIEDALLFALSLQSNDILLELDDELVSPELQTHFQNNNRPLSVNAAVNVLTQGNQWGIADTDNDQTYNVEWDGNSLKVFGDQDIAGLRYNWNSENQRLGEQFDHLGGDVNVYNYDDIYRVNEFQLAVEFPGVHLDDLGQNTPVPITTSSARYYKNEYTYDDVHNFTSTQLSQAERPIAFADLAQDSLRQKVCTTKHWVTSHEIQVHECFSVS